MIKDYASGVILFYRFPNKIKYLLLKHRQGHWAFCKGHKKTGEVKIDTAIRELKEETGITKIILLRKSILVRESYIMKNGYGVKKLKINDFFIAESKKKKVIIDEKEIINYRWCGYNAALSQITFNQSKIALKKANKIIDAYIND
jgi:8-oxo-dGTP pyrophosphatase MutT (NUDIX family)